MQSKVMAILSSSGFVDSSEGCEGPVGLVLDSTNFYAEQGGQVADVGSFTSSSGHTFEVQDTQVSDQLLCLPVGLFWVEGLPICISVFLGVYACASVSLSICMWGSLGLIIRSPDAWELICWMDCVFHRQCKHL